MGLVDLQVLTRYRMTATSLTEDMLTYLLGKICIYFLLITLQLQITKISPGKASVFLAWGALALGAHCFYLPRQGFLI